MKLKIELQKIFLKNKDAMRFRNEDVMNLELINAMNFIVMHIWI